MNPEPCCTDGGVPVSILDNIEKGIECWSKMKTEFANMNLQELPSSIEDSSALLKPFNDSLELKYIEMTQELLSYKDICVKENKGRYFHLLGKVCNLLDDRAHEALPHFERAAKFIPHKIEVWNDLGDCYLSLGNLEMAKNCFNEALRRVKNSWSYRSLSVVCRKEASESGCDVKNAVDLGVSFAKEAIKLDPTDSYSWMILGNAYMAYFLVSREDSIVPVKALQAYVQAEKNSGQFPELFFNKAIALLYAEDYAKCLEALEESIRRDPVWKLPWEKYYSVRDYIKKLSVFCHTKGKFRVKQISHFIHALNRECSLVVSTKFSCVTLSDLVEGVNIGKLILGKMLWSCEIDDSFPFTFGIVDGFCNFGVVTVFNLKTGIGVKIGDTVSIPNPNFSCNMCTVYRILKIRVDSPRDITVNGKPLPDCHIGQSLTVTKCE